MQDPASDGPDAHDIEVTSPAAAAAINAEQVDLFPEPPAWEDFVRKNGWPGNDLRFLARTRADLDSMTPSTLRYVVLVVAKEILNCVPRVGGYGANPSFD